jgi:hypothetical protein
MGHLVEMPLSTVFAQKPFELRHSGNASVLATQVLFREDQPAVPDVTSSSRDEMGCHRRKWSILSRH